MSQASKSQPTGMSIVTVSRCECPRCECVIRNEHVKREPTDTPPGAWPRHRLLAWCDKCDSLWSATREMQPGGVYELLAVEEITAERVKRPFVRACQRKLGALQVA